MVEILHNEMILIRHVHLGAEKIKEGKEPTETGVKVIKAIFPDLYQALINFTFEEAIDILNRHKENSLIKDDIEIILSPEGIEYVKKGLEFIKKYSQEEINSE
ncbi:MAG: hypothetical protein OEV21_05235 [Thermoplasmata archaeon]|nr:hypothetical protein [Thermoplasmata archaeon]